MAQVVAMGVVTAGVINSVSGRIVWGSLELAMHAAGGFMDLMRATAARWGAHPAVREEMAALDVEARVEAVQALLLTMRKQRGEVPVGESASSSSASASASTSSDEESTSGAVMVMSPASAYTFGGEKASSASDDVVDVCLRQVSQALGGMTTTLEALNTELAYHDTRWLSSWRSPDTATHMANLKSQALILDKRVDFLLRCQQAFAAGVALSSSSSHAHSAPGASTSNANAKDVALTKLLAAEGW